MKLSLCAADTLLAAALIILVGNKPDVAREVLSLPFIVLLLGIIVSAVIADMGRGG